MYFISPEGPCNLLIKIDKELWKTHLMTDLKSDAAIKLIARRGKLSMLNLYVYTCEADEAYINLTNKLSRSEITELMNTGNNNNGCFNIGDANAGWFNTGSNNNGYFNIGDNHRGWFNHESPVSVARSYRFSKSAKNALTKIYTKSTRITRQELKSIIELQYFNIDIFEEILQIRLEDVPIIELEHTGDHVRWVEKSISIKNGYVCIDDNEMIMLQ